MPGEIMFDVWENAEWKQRVRVRKGPEDFLEERRVKMLGEEGREWVRPAPTRLTSWIVGDVKWLSERSVRVNIEHAMYYCTWQARCSTIDREKDQREARQRPLTSFQWSVCLSLLTLTNIIFSGLARKKLVCLLHFLYLFFHFSFHLSVLFHWFSSDGRFEVWRRRRR